MKHNLKKMRKERKILAKEVAQYFGKTVRTIYRWESGETPIPPFFLKQYLEFLKAKGRKHEK